MSRELHLERGQAGKFCVGRIDPCGCGESYKKVTKNLPKSWTDYEFAEGGDGDVRKFEAHHILCCAAVNLLPDNASDAEAIADVIHETKWCINVEDNMIAMPLFGHTVLYYCAVGASRQYTRTGSSPPAFKDLPQHDIHHNTSGGYRDEVADDIRKIWDWVLKQVKNGTDCDKVVPKVVKKLDKARSDWRTKLKDRGKGTHAAWNKACTDDDFAKEEWIAPFSMGTKQHAIDNATAFPSKAVKKMKAIASAMHG